MSSLLIIDDDSSVRDVLSKLFTEEGYSVTLAENGEQALELLSSQKYDVYITDLVMPKTSGMEILDRVRNTPNASTPCIVITAFGSVKTAVDAMKLGALDYVLKPFRLDEILLVTKRALEVARLRDENLKLKRELKGKYQFHGIIGTSPEMQKVYTLIEKIADTDSTVLITGESGTGKELIARTIHYNSSRSQNNFVAINCAAIPKTLLESELFGHEKGSFTGAINTHIGRFEQASGGTLFLDEIGDLDPSLQVKILRVLQEREIQRIGGTKTIKVDVRILAATNKDIEKERNEGRFREDLFYRLNVIPLHLPPLRERREDIPVLIDYFLNKSATRQGQPAPVFTRDTLNLLLSYEWKGNVRELENLMENLVILKGGEEITPEDLPERYSKGRGEAMSSKQASLQANGIVLTEEGIDLNEVLDRFETHLILQALKLSGGVKSRASELLGLNRTTLVEKLKKKNISSPG
ncbi:MAG: sigma-54-dependent transcriptional regulator [bacterium]